MSEKWKEKLTGLRNEINRLLKEHPEIKAAGKGHNKTDKEIKNLLKLLENTCKQTKLSDDDLMDILNSIVVLSQMTSSQTLINVVQRRADYLWELHESFMKRR